MLIVWFKKDKRAMAREYRRQVEAKKQNRDPSIYGPRPTSLLFPETNVVPDVQPTAPAPAVQVPDWYPDPFDRFDARWWDGSRWTEFVGRVAPDGSRMQLIDSL